MKTKSFLHQIDTYFVNNLLNLITYNTHSSESKEIIKKAVRSYFQMRKSDNSTEKMKICDSAVKSLKDIDHPIKSSFYHQLSDCNVGYVNDGNSNKYLRLGLKNLEKIGFKNLNNYYKELHFLIRKALWIEKGKDNISINIAEVNKTNQECDRFIKEIKDSDYISKRLKSSAKTQFLFIKNDMYSLLYNIKGDKKYLVLAEKCLLDNLDILGKIHDTRNIFYTYYRLGSLFLTVYDTNEERKYLVKARKYFEMVTDYNPSVTSLFILCEYKKCYAECLSLFGEYEKSITILNEAIDINMKNYGRDNIRCAEYYELKSDIIMEMDYSKVNIALNMYKKAKKIYNIVSGKRRIDNINRIDNKIKMLKDAGIDKFCRHFKQKKEKKSIRRKCSYIHCSKIEEKHKQFQG